MASPGTPAQRHPGLNLGLLHPQVVFDIYVRTGTVSPVNADVGVEDDPGNREVELELVVEVCLLLRAALGSKGHGKEECEAKDRQGGAADCLGHALRMRWPGSEIKYSEVPARSRRRYLRQHDSHHPDPPEAVRMQQALVGNFRLIAFL